MMWKDETEEEGNRRGFAGSRLYPFLRADTRIAMPRRQYDFLRCEPVFALPWHPDLY